MTGLLSNKNSALEQKMPFLGFMLISIHPDSPEQRKVDEVVQLLRNDAVVIIPSDSVYSFACALGSGKGLEKMARLRDIAPEDSHFSLICKDLSQVSEYTAPHSQTIFKLMKRALPGPYTFILEAGSKVPRLFRKSKKTVGIRIPDHGVPSAIVEALGKPLVVSSVVQDGDVVEYLTDAELVHEKYSKRVAAVVQGGIGNNEPSTVIDCTSGEAHVVREGRGVVEGIL